jgi:hypothetical protein
MITTPTVTVAVSAVFRPLLGEKRAQLEANHLLLSSAEVKNAWINTSSSAQQCITLLKHLTTAQHINRMKTEDDSLQHRPDDGGSRHLWNVGLLQRDHMALCPTKLSSSYWPPWESEISQNGDKITKSVPDHKPLARRHAGWLKKTWTDELYSMV